LFAVIVMDEERRLSAIDFLVNVIREHEKALDALEEKLEKLVTELTKVKTERVPSTPLVVRCKRWSEFKDVSVGCDMVVFQIEGGLTVYGLRGSRVTAYSEALPSRLSCGLEVRVELNRDEVREWLSRELEVEKTRIVEGEIYAKRSGNSSSTLLK